MLCLSWHAHAFFHSLYKKKKWLLAHESSLSFLFPTLLPPFYFNSIINSVGTPPSMTHGVHSTRIDPGCPSQEDTWRTPLSGSPREEHTALASIMHGRQYILSKHIVWIINCSKQAFLSHPRQSATANIPPPAERKDRSNGKLPPTISDSRLQGDDGPATILRTSWRAKKSSHH